jgi:hypothetical protein
VIAAARQYDPPVYPGCLTLFRRTKEKLDEGETADFGWTGMALGGLDIIEVPASHLDMPLDPIVACALRERVSNRPATFPSRASEQAG